MENRPKISVLMSVYNGEAFIREAIESILQQTFKDFEFLIINDCSTDHSLDIILSYNDSRIKVVNNQTNIGLTKSLNVGLKLALGKYIARIDADDFSYKDRLEMQFNYLEQNIEIGVLGTQAISNGRYFKYKTKLPLDDYLIKWNLFFTNPIVHPSAMFRKDILTAIGGYNEEKRVGQDYDLWIRLFFKTKFANLEEPYLFLRRHDNNISLNYTKLQMITAIDTITTFLDTIFNRKLTNHEMEAFFFHRILNKEERIKVVLFFDDVYNNFLNIIALTKKQKEIILKNKNRKQFELKYPIWTKFKNHLLFKFR